MSKHAFTAKSPSLCGHDNMTSFSYGKGARTQERLYASATLCAECSAKVMAAVPNAVKGFHKMALPTMLGRAAQIKWANSIRLGFIRQLGPVMSELAKQADPLSVAALAVYEMLFKIQLASFWIDNRESKFTSTWVRTEVECLLRDRLHSAILPSTMSAFDYWNKTDFGPIRDACANIEQVREYLGWHQELLIPVAETRALQTA